MGDLQYLTDEADGKVLWLASERNDLGQVTKEQTRNGVETTLNRNPATGWLLSSTSVAHGEDDKLIQSWQYHYDEAGNLTYRGRSDTVNPEPSQETFTYDKLDRLL